MLGTRFKNNGKNVWYLNKKQLSTRDQVIDKLNNKEYELKKVSCAICNSRNFEQLSEKERFGIPLSVVICKICGLVQTNPRMSKEAYNNFYNNEYKILFDKIHGSDELYYRIIKKRARCIYSYIQDYLKTEIKNKFVVEIGTGVGGILSYFKEKGNEVYGVDLTQRCVHFCKKKGLNVELGSTEKLGKLKKSPDILIYSHILEHIPEPLEELRKIKNLAKDGCLIFIAVPGIKNLYNTHEMNFLRYLELPHVYHYTKETLINLFHKEGGYKIIKINYKINALIKVDKSVKCKKYVSDYADCLVFLKKLEKDKIKYLSKYGMETIIIKFLKKIGVFSTIKKAYFKYGKFK
ncbi:MAG: class I SAM-dependent methyltransferase [Nanoarchaeota archaeon]